MAHSRERRQFFRSIFHAPVRLTLPGGPTSARLIDLSLKGALVEVDKDWPGQAGQACQMHLELAPGAVIQMATTVVHVRDGRAGLRAEYIDLDSLTHLRLLIERNAEDPALLERDLGKLVQR